MRKTVVLIVAVMLWTVFGYSVVPTCYRTLETGIFQPVYVGQALSFHRIPQGAWEEIDRILQQNIKRIPAMIDAEARKMNPNPFEPTFQPKLAKKLLEDVQMRVLSDTLAQFNVTDQQQVKQIYNYIKERNRALFIACFGEEEEDNSKKNQPQSHQ